MLEDHRAYDQSLEKTLCERRCDEADHASPRPTAETHPCLGARILAKTQQAPPDGSTHWSLRKMAAVIGVGKELIPRCGRKQI